MGLYEFDVTMSALEQALSGQAVRQRIIAQNLANIDTPGYRPRRVRFEEQLRAALRAENAEQAQIALQRVQPQIVLAPGGALRRDENAVDVEAEISALTECTLHFAALIRLLNHKLRMLRTVATEGNKL